MDDRASLLIVDDERGPAESLRMIFKPSYDVFVANSGPEALDILASSAIDVVTLDLRMPVMSGVEVMERIKAHDPDIEVIVVTGYSSAETAITSLRHGVFDYISKPFDVPHISDLVRRAVERRNQTLKNRRVKEDFLANVSHELRTPLNAILGYSSILGEELDAMLTEDQRFWLRRLQCNSADLYNMVESVLLLTELDTDGLELAVDRIDLTSMLQQAAAKFRARAHEKQLAFELNLPDDDVVIVGDQDKLERVVWALLDNAVKFTDSGQVTTTLRRTERGAPRIDIVDSGIGMEASDAAAALAGLSPVDASLRRRFRGLGLGYRIASRLLDLMEGKLEVQSKPNEGTRVSLILPSNPMGGGLH